MAKDKKKSKDVTTEAPAKVKKSKVKDSAPVEDDEEEDDLDPKGPGDGIRMADLVDELLLVVPTAIRRKFKTANGETDTIVADVVVLDADKPKKSEKHSGVLIFQTVLVGNLEDRVGTGMIAAKLVRGEAKGGNSAPFLFEKSDEAKAAARAYLKANGPAV